MVEVRDIESNELPPEDSDHVLIERAGARFVAIGSAAGTNSATFFSPPAFDTVAAAVTAAIDWAELNDVPVVYVKAIP